MRSAVLVAMLVQGCVEVPIAPVDPPDTIDGRDTDVVVDTERVDTDTEDTVDTEPVVIYPPLLTEPPALSGGYVDITPAAVRDAQPEGDTSLMSIGTFCQLDADANVEIIFGVDLGQGYGVVYELRDGVPYPENWTLEGVGIAGDAFGPLAPWVVGCIDLDNDGVDEIIQTSANALSTSSGGSWHPVTVTGLPEACGAMVSSPSNAIGVDDYDGNGLLDVSMVTVQRFRHCGVGPVVFMLQQSPGVFTWVDAIPNTVWQDSFGMQVVHDADPYIFVVAGFIPDPNDDSPGLYVHEPNAPSLSLRPEALFDANFTRSTPMGMAIVDLDGDGLAEVLHTGELDVVGVHSRRAGLWFNTSAVNAMRSPPPVGAPPRSLAMFPWGLAPLHLSRRLLPDVVVVHGDDETTYADGSLLNHRIIAHWHRGVTASGASFGQWPIDALGDLGQFHNGRGLSTADVDHDGDQDLLVTGAYEEGPRLYLDDIHVDGKASTTIRLRGRTNSVGAGARMQVTLPDGRRAVHWVSPGGSPNTLNAPEWSVGMEDFETATLEVTWPGGAVQTVTLSPSTYTVVEEP